MRKGLHLALLGIDGAGKTTVARALVAHLKMNGVSAETLSWKKAMTASDSVSSALLAQISSLIYRLQFLRAAVPESDRDTLQWLNELADTQTVVREASGRLRAIGVSSNDASAFVPAALMELAGGIVFHYEFIRRKVEDGFVVVDESFGFKHVLKNLLVSRALSPSASQALHDASAAVLRAATDIYFGTLAPDHGFFVDTPPVLAEGWKREGGEPPTAFETYGLAGAVSSTTFQSFQEDCRREFSSVCTSFGWKQIQMGDASAEENIRKALLTITTEIGVSVDREYLGLVQDLRS